MSTLTLDEYQAELAAEITAFQAYWTAEQKKAPEHFPDSMGPGEWDEQFRLWQTTRNS